VSSPSCRCASGGRSCSDGGSMRWRRTARSPCRCFGPSRGGTACTIWCRWWSTCRARSNGWVTPRALTPAARRHQFEEIGLPGLFLAILAVWARDDTFGRECTCRFLDRRLSRVEMVMALASGGDSANGSRSRPVCSRPLSNPLTRRR
jgi:hypothetical protein